MFKSIFECALMATALDHRDANASVMKFFYDLFHQRSSDASNVSSLKDEAVCKALTLEY